MTLLDRQAQNHMFDFLSLKGSQCGYLDISEAIIDAIACGRLPPNSALPPSRVLAEALGVSRDTALNCYRHLKALGWTESHGTAGTFVAHGRCDASIAAETQIDTSRLSKYAVELPDSQNAVYSCDASMYGAVPKQFVPVRRWKAAIQRGSENLPRSPLEYETAVLGIPELRSAVAAYLNRCKGISCTAEEIAVFNISFTALATITRLFLEPGDLIAVEHPGYGGMRDVASYFAFDVLNVPLDREGICMQTIEQSQRPIRIVYVTANHQEPTCVTMSLERRRQLLSWAQRNQAIIIEDDYDGLFHYGSRMPPSLKAMDTGNNVVHLSSFWQVLFPLTTLAFAAVPQTFMGVLQKAKIHTASLTENLTQLAIADMLNDGYLQKYCRKLERELAASRRALIYELKRAFGRRVNIATRTGGLTLMARFDGFSDETLIEAARITDLPMSSTTRFYIEPGRPNGEFQFHFAFMPEASVGKTVTQFAACLT
jgi:GntR family transcriptional regulator/MocR family aminotransferase